MKLQQLNAAGVLTGLSVPTLNQLEGLTGNRKVEYSIRINGHWRICFKWREGHAFDVVTKELWNASAKLWSRRLAGYPGPS